MVTSSLSALFVLFVSSGCCLIDKCTVTGLSSSLPSPSASDSPTTSAFMSKGQGVCRVEVAKVEWDALQPWQRSPQHKSTGTTFVIEGERLLTNAHVVKSATDIRVRLHGSTRRFPAKVICYAPEVDLALLKILGEKEHDEFFAQPVGVHENVATDKGINIQPKSSMALKFAAELPHLQEVRMNDSITILVLLFRLEDC
jgi:S1-C subfamily serine protease